MPARHEEDRGFRPAFFLGRAIIYFAPFKHHVGIFPPVTGDAALRAKQAARRR